MPSATAASVIDDVLRREAGFVDHPDDHGGPTKFGITQRTLSEWRSCPVTPDDVAALPEAEAREIYQRLYIQEPGYQQLFYNKRLMAVMVDAGILRGPAQATRMLQRIVNTPADGVIGPGTLAAIRVFGADNAYRRMVGAMLRHFVRRVLDDQSQIAFVDGWIDRYVEFVP